MIGSLWPALLDNLISGVNYGFLIQVVYLMALNLNGHHPSNAGSITLLICISSAILIPFGLITNPLRFVIIGFIIIGL